MIAYSLQRCGATAVGVGSAEAALAESATSTFAVVISDLSLPDRDGVWLVEQMRVLGVAATAIALTRMADDATKARCSAAGFVAFMRKPTDVDLLCQVVAGLVGRE